MAVIDLKFVKFEFRFHDLSACDSYKQVFLSSRFITSPYANWTGNRRSEFAQETVSQLVNIAIVAHFWKRHILVTVLDF